MPPEVYLYTRQGEHCSRSKDRELTMNLGFRNRDNSCLFEKCMSSGRSFSSLLSKAPFFLFPPIYTHCFAGNVSVPLAGGSNSFLSNSAVLRFEKSIEKTSFSLRGLGAVDASVRSAVGNSVSACQEQTKGNYIRLRITLRSFQCSGPAQFLVILASK